MAKFIYRMQNILDIKYKLEETEKQNFAAALQRLRNEEEKLQHFTNTIAAMKKKGEWTRGELIDLFNYMIPNFNHRETGKFLDSRM